MDKSHQKLNVKQEKSQVAGTIKNDIIYLNYKIHIESNTLYFYGMHK